MATAYMRLRMLWGALDITAAQGQTPMYSPTQIVTGGAAAAAGSGVGVRKASLLIDRTLEQAGADPAFMHFDFLNTTGGSPDDTWTTADYTTLEGALNTFWGAVAGYAPTGCRFTELRWHRTGTGVSKPNPAERVTTVATPVNGSGGARTPPQVATSITFRTGARRNWGRTYLPIGDQPLSFGRPTTTMVDAVTTATNALVTAAATADFHLVVVSKPLASSLNVERVEVDDVADVVRRRRWKNTTYRKILP